ncbi:hypothetical protein DK261_17385 [Pseudomonas sp. RW409]|nr:hypothetical protein DK261_17385 [Pseudomonas sp. RW409]
MICTINTLPHVYMRWGLMPLLTGTVLLSLSTIAGAKISNPPWVNFQSAGWVSFQSAPTKIRRKFRALCVFGNIWRFRHRLAKPEIHLRTVFCADGGNG